MDRQQQSICQIIRQMNPLNRRMKTWCHRKMMKQTMTVNSEERKTLKVRRPLVQIQS